MSENIESKNENTTTWAAKVPEELKIKISNIIKDQNITSKEFLGNIIELYEIEKLKKNSGIEKDIVDFESNLSRIFDIFKNAVTRNNSLELNIKSKYDKALTEKDKEIQELKDILKKRDSEKEEENSKSKKTLEALSNKEKELSRIIKENEKNDELNKNYKDQIEELKEKIKTYEEYKNQHDTLLKKNEFLKESVSNVNKEISSLNSSITNLKNNYKSEKQMLEIEKEKEILSIKAKHQEVINCEREKFSKELKTCHDLIFDLKEELMKSTIEKINIQKELESTTNKVNESKQN